VSRHLFLFVLALAAALFLSLWNQAPSFTISRHALRLAALPLLLAAIVLYALLLGVWALSSRQLGRISGLDLARARRLDLPTYAPLAFFLLAPLSLAHYLTRDDLRQRLCSLALAVMAAVLCLKLAAFLRNRRPGVLSWRSWLDAFVNWPLKRRIVVLALLAVLAANVGARIMDNRGISFGGDEPHYLMIAHSLLMDGDLDLANNYRQQDYAFFLPPQVRIQPHTVPGKQEGSFYSFHSPGIAVLLLPFYALGLLLGKAALVFLVRFAMSLFGAFLGIQIYLYAREAWQREALALGLWALAAFTTPLFFYSIHVYPEIVVAAAGLYAFRRLRQGRPAGSGELAAVGLLLASFVWFHALKYFFIQGPLFILALWSIWRGGGTQGRVRRLAALLLPAGICFAAYFLFQKALYGSFNPTSVSWQGAMDGRQTVSFLKGLFTGIPFRFRWETLAGYFLDQRDGLLPYAPVYAFAFIGAIAMLRDRFRDAAWLLFIAAPYILASAFLTQRTGHAPQARPLVAVIWVLAVFIGAFINRAGKPVYRRLFSAAAAFSVLATWMLCRSPFALYQETTFGTSERAGRLFIELSHLHFYLPGLLPSFVKSAVGGWPPNYAWVLVLGLFVGGFFLLRPRPARAGSAAPTAIVFVLLALVFFLAVLYPRPVLVQPREVVMPDGEHWTFYSLSLMARMGEPGTFALLQDDRQYDFYFSTREPVARLEVVFGSRHGDYVIRLHAADEKVFALKTRREVLSRTFAQPPAYRWQGRNLYRVSVHLDKKSAVRTAVTPFVFALAPGH
jgi:hypothetical protein